MAPPRQDPETIKAERQATASEICRIKSWADANCTLGESNLNPYALRKKLEQVEEAYRIFRQCHRHLEIHDQEEINNPIRTKVDENWFDAVSTLEGKLRFLECKHIKPELKAPNPPTLMPMPQIKLPTFSGDDPSQWLSFHSKFNSMINSKPFEIAYKFDILRQSLSGEAARQIQDLEVTDKNYEVALELLTARWHNPRLLVTSHLDKIFNLPRLTNPDSNQLLSLVDTIRSNLRALKTLERNTEGYDDVVSYWVMQRLDSDVRRRFDESSDPQKMPALEVVLKWIEGHAQTLRLNKPKSNRQTGKCFTSPGDQAPSSCTTRDNKAPNRTITCSCCSDPKHNISRCPQFKALALNQRRDKVKTLHLCFNCLGKGHDVKSCRSILCRDCGGAHHTLLCHAQRTDITSKPSTSEASRGTVAHNSSHSSYALLPTAIVLLQDIHGDWIPIRALLDSGSQFNLITERCRQLLGLDKKKSTVRIHTLGGTVNNTSTSTCMLKSRLTNYSIRLEALVQKKITSHQPSQRLALNFKIPSNVCLADPEFHTPGRIDLLLSVEVTAEIGSVGCISLGSGMPRIQNTLLGWVVSGRINDTSTDNGICYLTTETSRDIAAERDLERFWRLEDIGDMNERTFTPSELNCLHFFDKTTDKTPDGSYRVRIPFKEPLQPLGDSKSRATHCLQSQMRRLARDPPTMLQYEEFMSKYLSLGHMTEVKPIDESRIKYFIPHHCVLKPDSTTTKLRVVFNASATTSNGSSWNDIQEKGPTLQEELFDILTRFRTHVVSLGTDIEKMFRQVRVHDDDTWYQCIMWAGQIYRLLTVTYGTKSAPFLAVATLRKCATDGAATFPLASQKALADFYMDNLLSGASTDDGALQLYEQLTALFKTCNMPLRQWVSNSTKVIQHIPEEDRGVNAEFDTETVIKTLGMYYCPFDDTLRVRVDVDTKRRITKRHIQSDIATTFDPLGLLSPVVVTLKLILQRLWALHLDWDAAVPQDLFTNYDQLRNQLPSLRDLRIPRRIVSIDNPKTTELHGFCDASESAYGACVYLRCIDQNNTTIRLICSKTKVAPLEKLTLARLELCAAELLMQLITRLRDHLGLDIAKIICWTDSKTVLLWLQKESRLFYTFVANRVSRIRAAKFIYQWRHIPTKLNPADMLSRGVTPQQFTSNDTLSLWLSGPSFLKESEASWPPIMPNIGTVVLPELKPTKPSGVNVMATLITGDLVSKVSRRFHHSAMSLIRVFGHVGRFIDILRSRRMSRVNGDPVSRHPPLQQTTENVPELSFEELQRGNRIILKTVQSSAFRTELDLLRHDVPIRRGPLRSLAAFIDTTDGLLRVGGRLQRGDIPYDTQSYFPLDIVLLEH